MRFEKIWRQIFQNPGRIFQNLALDLLAIAFKKINPKWSLEIFGTNYTNYTILSASRYYKKSCNSCNSCLKTFLE